MPQANLLTIPVGEIFPDPSQPRQHFEQEAIDRMEASIRARGILHPLRVRYDAERACWLIVSGECRWRAAKQAGLVDVPAWPVEGELSEIDRLSDQLIENCVRNNLLPMEEARSLDRLRKLKGCTAGELAKELGLTDGSVSKSKSLLKLPEDIQAKIEAGIISADTGYAISQLPDVSQQRELAEQVVKSGLSRDQTAAMVKSQLPPKNKPSKALRATYRLPGGITITVSAEKPLTFDTLLASLDQLRQQADTLQHSGKPMADLPAALAEPAVIAIKARPAAKAKPAKPATPPNHAPAS